MPRPYMLKAHALTRTGYFLIRLQFDQWAKFRFLTVTS